MTIDFFARWVIKSISASGDFLFTYVFIASEQVTLREEGDLLALVDRQSPSSEETFLFIPSISCYVRRFTCPSERTKKISLSRSLPLVH